MWPPRRDRAPWVACGLGGARADARFVRQVRAPAGRLRLPRQIGDALGGVEQFLLVDDVVAVEDGAALMAGQAQGDPLGDAGADQGAGGGAPAIVEGRCCMNTRCEWGGVARTSRDPPQEPHYRDAVEGPSHV